MLKNAYIVLNELFESNKNKELFKDNKDWKLFKSDNLKHNISLK